MKNIVIKTAKRDELDWINSKYEEVNFALSDFDNEHIIIAEVENHNAGIGRLVQINKHHIELGGIYVFSDYRNLGVAEKIVDNLCKQNPFNDTMIWCLPFENLLPFYTKFGFKKYTLSKNKEG